MRLVDPKKPFQIVYSVYEHQYLGYLVSPHAVQELSPEQLSLVHQSLFPDNMEQFASGLSDEDRTLIKTLHEVSPREIVKRFGGNPRDRASFFTEKFKGDIIRLAQGFIQRRMGKVMPLLKDRLVYIMGKDGYPAQTRISVLKDKASILFHFRKKENFTRYYPTIKLRGEKIDFQRQDAKMLCLDPAWLLLHNELFTFDRYLDGKKLKPFLKKDFIAIPGEKEEEYYRKFITQIVEQYPVFVKGFEIRPIEAQARFSLLVQEHNQSSFSFIRQVSYDRFTFPLDTPGSQKAFFEKKGDQFCFFLVKRASQQEKPLLAELDNIPPNRNSLTPWEYVAKDTGLRWLSTHSRALQEQGIKILQENKEYLLNLTQPEIVMHTEEVGDWFDIKAVVKVGAFEIPFVKFRQHILRQNREYVLPDGTIAILPEHWFSDYRHLLEISEKRSDDGEVFSIRRYQAPLLNFPSQHNGRVKWVESIKELDQIPQVAPPENFYAELRSYQASGYNWLHFMKSHGMGCILADDMGLGKTVQALALLQKEKESEGTGPSLVVVPTSLIYNWRSEAATFAPDLKVYLHTGINRSRDLLVFADQDLILTTYGIVRQDIKHLKSFPFHYVILDESQMIKNPDSKTAQAVRKLVARHRLSLTGTPIENTVMDIWAQMAFLNPGLLGTERFFKKFYVTPIEREKDAVRSAKLRRIIYPFILRRRKQQVERDLPPKIEKLQYCAMTDPQRDFYDETRSSYRNYLMELINQGAWKKNKLNILTGLQKLRQIAIHPQMLEPEAYTLDQSGKYQEVKRMLKQVIGKKRSKVLIFSQFVKMLHLLRDDLIAEDISFTYLDGSTKDRAEQVRQFQEDREIRVFLISLKAGGVGLNLTAADYVFILDPWWNPAVENQAVDRSHRIGQDRTVFYYKFITQDSIEEKILSLQKQKAQLSDDIITVEEDIYKTLNEVDLDALLQE